MIQVAILAPSLLLRMGLREMLRGMDDVVVAGEATSPAELATFDHEAEIILMTSASTHWFEPEGNFLGQQAILLLSDDPILAQALAGRGGAWGILPPDPSPEALSAGIQAIHQGLTILPSRVAATLWQASERHNSIAVENLNEPLTPREVQILGLIAQGLANKQIAARLGISDHTVKFHLSSVYAKLGANSRTEAVRLGMLQGVIVI